MEIEFENCEYDNKNRFRYYGLRKGDIVLYHIPGTICSGEEYVVYEYGTMNNNQVYLKDKDGNIGSFIAEFCEIVKKVDDSDDLDDSNDSVLIHINNWKWGRSFTIIENDATAVIEFTVSNDEPELAYLKGLSVHCDSRKEGLGNKMLDTAMTQAKRNGCKYAYLHAEKDSFVFDWYKRKGFKYYGDAPDENGFVVMYTEL